MGKRNPKHIKTKKQLKREKFSPNEEFNYRKKLTSIVNSISVEDSISNIKIFINKSVKFLSEFNKIRILDYFAIQDLQQNITEWEYEYILNLCAVSENPSEKEPTKNNLEDFLINIRSIFLNAEISYIKDDKISNIKKRTLKFRSLTKILHQDRDSYPNHHQDLILGLFSDSNDFYQRHYGFRISDIFDFIDKLKSQIFKSLELLKKRESLLSFKENFIEDEIRKKRSDNPFIDLFFKITEGKIPNDEIEEALARLNKPLFQIEITDAINLNILKSFSSEFGDNKIFLNPTHKNSISAFPLNPSNLKLRPIIHFNGYYYMYALSMFHKYLIPTLNSNLFLSAVLINLKKLLLTFINVFALLFSKFKLWTCTSISSV